ncbi:uncharacterized protein TNCV_625971 [Trichonephila clavipes]|nr:uncharacterized protein TNCV_625971 [Trichonephila clavipes]
MFDCLQYCTLRFAASSRRRLRHKPCAELTDSGELSCSNLDSDEDMRLSESDCEESKENADVIDNIPVNLDIYVTRDGTEWIPHNSNVPGRFATRNVFEKQ